LILLHSETQNATGSESRIAGLDTDVTGKMMTDFPIKIGNTFGTNKRITSSMDVNCLQLFSNKIFDGANSYQQFVAM
jgi:hypothetical protein